jgi:catechol 2,3-dioxygenase-like lactoylglutathione lyase family enzyme
MRRTILTAACLAIGLLGCKDRRERASPLAELAKTCTGGSEISCPRPIFTVRDLRATQRYYRDALGFKLDWEYGEPPDFASVSRGDGVLFMCQGCPGRTGAWVMMFTPDVDRLHEELRRKEAIIKMPPTDMPWGVREMHVEDPDGNVMRFGGPSKH